jgi:hypothetical protein
VSSTSQPAQASAPPRKGRERRVTVRYAINKRGLINVVAVLKEGVQAAHVHDISAGGIALVMEMRLQPGVLLTAELYNSSRLFFCSRLMRVTHVAEKEDGGYLIGCQFSSPLAYDQLQALLW